MNNSREDLLIISGISGSGKSVALQSLEDIGYYCIDNLPAALLPEFHRAFAADAHGRAALGIDSRNRHFLSQLEETLALLQKNGATCRILFLDADDESLLKRYSETRRKHPLTGRGTPLADGIRKERLLLQPLRARAAKVFDTSKTTPHELRALIRDFVGGAAAAPAFFLQSFGFKYGAPAGADFIFDVRCLPNPYWRDELRELTGLDRPVIAFLRGKKKVAQMIEEIFAFFERWLPGFIDENRSYISIGIGCTGGRHRSVYVVESLKQRFSEKKFAVQIKHRELPGADWPATAESSAN